MTAPASRASPPPLNRAALAGVTVFVAGLLAATLFLIPDSGPRLLPEERSPARLFEARCAACHGPSGAGQGTFPNLIGTRLTVQQISIQILQGKGMMPAQRDLSPEQREILAKYVKSFR